MLLPKTVSAKDIQRNYRDIFNTVKKTKDSVVVLTNNSPDVAIVDIGKMEDLLSKARKLETIEAINAIKTYKVEKSKDKLKNLKSLKDLM